MKIRRPRHPTAALPDDATIDALYGLEPVIEPDAGGAAAAERGTTSFERVHCPFCGEGFETRVDLSAGSSAYIEDCQVCCQPIEMQLEVDADGTLRQLTARRGD